MKTKASSERVLSQLAQLQQRFDSDAPELELTVRDPQLGVEGYVVVSNTLASIGGPLGRCGKGGTRVTPTVSLDEVAMLARIMTLKNAAAGIPLGGAKSGLRADPNDPEIEKKYRRFVQLVKPILREHGGIFGGFGFDIGGRPEHALWACDELQSLRCFTGKPLAMGGTDYDREGIAGFGVAIAARTMLEFGGEPVAGCSFAVQGIGAMGAAVIKYFSAFGGRLVTVSDPRMGGTFELPEALSDSFVETLSDNGPDAARELISHSGIGAQPLDAILASTCEIFFPCALQDVITGDAAQIAARCVVEGANNPTTSEARTALHRRGVLVIPDFIANPGGILAAFVELSSQVAPDENVRTKAKVREAKALTEQKIGENVRAMLELCKSDDLEPSQAARWLALQRVYGGTEPSA